MTPWCERWVRAQGGGAPPPADRPARIAAALAAWGIPCTEAVVEADRVLYGLELDQARFGVVEALAAHEGVPLRDRPATGTGARLIPLTYPAGEPEVWCDDRGAMSCVLPDLGVCEPTFDSAEHLLEAQALQRVYLPERGDRYGFETQAYVGAEAAGALGLPVLPALEGERSHAWADDRGVVVEARVEQYLYGTSLGLRDGAAVAAVLAALPEGARKGLRIIKGARPEPDDETGTPEQAYAIAAGEVRTYRRGDVVTVAYHPRTYRAA